MKYSVEPITMSTPTLLEKKRPSATEPAATAASPPLSPAPLVVADPSSFPPEPASSSSSSSNSSEAMWGRLTLIGCGSGGLTPLEQRVLVKVYRTTLEHFAVVYPDKRVAKPVGCFNLKNTRVEPLANCERSFRVVQRDCDGLTLQFRSDSSVTRARWLTSMRPAAAQEGGRGKSPTPASSAAAASSPSPPSSPSSSTPHHHSSMPLLPVVQEDDEE